MDDIYKALKIYENDDFQDCHGSEPCVGIPYAIKVEGPSNAYIACLFKDTSAIVAKNWLYTFLRNKGYEVTSDDFEEAHVGKNAISVKCMLKKLHED